MDPVASKKGRDLVILKDIPHIVYSKPPRKGGQELH